MGVIQRRATMPLPLDNLLTSHRLAGLWAVVRVLLGWAWLQAGWRMAQDTAWMQGDRFDCVVESGVANARPIAMLLICQGSDPGWLSGAAGAWVARVAAIVATLLGIAVILGVLTGPAMLVGSLAVFVALPPPAVGWAALQLAAVAALLAARSSAGWIGIDRWLAPLMGRLRRVPHHRIANAEMQATGPRRSRRG